MIPTLTITKKFTFDSAHFLPNYVGKCKQMHGHTYILEVSIEGKINPDTGMVIDFHQIQYVVQSKVISVLDHRLINDIIPNPTAENIIIWVRDQVSGSFKDTPISLKLWENSDSYVELK